MSIAEGAHGDGRPGACRPAADLARPANSRRRATSAIECGGHRDLHHVGPLRAHAGVEVVEVVGRALEVVEGDHEARARPWRPSPRGSGCGARRPRSRTPAASPRAGGAAGAGSASSMAPPSERERQVKRRGLVRARRMARRSRSRTRSPRISNMSATGARLDHAVDERRRASSAGRVTQIRVKLDSRKSKSLFRIP